MKGFWKDFVLAFLIAGIMTFLFKWGYGGADTFPQWIVYFISYLGTYMSVRFIIDEFSGRY